MSALMVVSVLTVGFGGLAGAPASADPGNGNGKKSGTTTTTLAPTTTVPPTTTTVPPTTTTTVPPTTTTLPPTTTTTTTLPPTTTTTTLPPTGSPTGVVANGAVANDGVDDTAAFLRAEDAALASSYRVAGGPTGSPQAVVTVPAGTWNLLRLPFRSDIRMEVDAGAVLQQAGGRGVDVRNSAPSLINWDGLPGAELTNVTLIGVGSSTGGLKTAADPVYPGWSLDTSFTFNLDPAATDASVLVTGLQALNVRGFLIQNVYSIQNDFQPAVAASTDDGWWPQSRKAALGLRERNDTPLDGSVFYDPHDGKVANWYNIRAPKGFGPNQVNAGHNLSFSHIFSSGGTAMRFETDASQGKSFASEIRGATADDIAGRDCNRAVSFAPHSQNNYDVHVTHVRAVGCAQGVVESIDESTTLPPGAFFGSTISDVVVTAGANAQLTVAGSGGLSVAGPSDRAFAKDKPLQALWSVVYSSGTYGCSGPFTTLPDLVMTGLGLLRPVCT